MHRLCSPEPRIGGRTISVVLLLLLLVCLTALPAAGQEPTLITITPDGLYEDWTSVLANPDNVTRDGDGASVPCVESTDRDCIVPSNAGDLDLLAWTYDQTNLYVYVKRFATPSGSDSIFLHVDQDRDGFVEDSERIARMRYNGSNDALALEVFSYEPVDLQNGDPVRDALGYADGYTMPGTLGASLFTAPETFTAQLEFLEMAIPWSALGVTGPTPFLFHLGVDNSCCSPNATEDNLGGPDDGPGDIGFLLHDVKPSRTGAFGPNEPIEYAHSVANQGNLPDSYSARAFSSEGYRLEILEDTTVPPDGVGDILLGVDRRGNGDFTGSQDELYRDADGDTLPESPVLAPGESWNLVIRIIATSGAKSFVERTTLVTASLSGDRVETVQDLSAVGEVTLVRDLDLSVEPGTTLQLCHQLANHMDSSTLLDFTWSSIRGWSYELWTDPDADCDPSDGFRIIADSNANGLPDLNLTARETVSLVAVAPVPSSAPVGSTELFILDAISDINQSNATEGSVTDRIAVSDLLNLSPSYTLAEGSAKSAAPGRRIWFRHVLTYSGETEDSFQVSATVPGAHQVTLYSDPNGDGLPADGTLLGPTASTGALPPNGGTFPFLVAVDIDPAATRGQTITATLEASSESVAGLVRSIDDEMVIANIAAFADPLYVLQESRYPLCSTIHARASSLLPGREDLYRMRWVLEPDTEIRVHPFSSDADGAGYDELTLDATAAPGAYLLLLEEWDGAAWQELDRDAFTVDDLGVLDSLATDRPRYYIDGSDLGITARFLNEGGGNLRDQLIRYAVLSPDATQVLQMDGTFTAAAPDVWTRTSETFDLTAGASHVDAFTVPAVSFPEEGIYTLRAVGEGSCGTAVASVEVTFEVYADSDEDGWRDDLEESLGTDPYDRDTDDDGLLDPVDGDADTDGDTLIDALDCDADDDGLFDGLETGLLIADLDADTDLQAGCFTEDADGGLVVTDRLLADTDGGGEPDGAEDLNANGRFDPGEKDPLDATDDPCSWLAPPEVPDLRLGRDGPFLTLSWGDLSAADACVSYRVLRASGPSAPTSLDAFTPLTASHGGTSWVCGGCGLGNGELHWYLLRAQGRIGGLGAVGHYGE